MKKIRCIVLWAFLMVSCVGCGMNNISDNKENEKNIDSILDSEDENLEESTLSEKIEQHDWIEKLHVAENTNQIIVVAAEGSSAVVSVHNKNEEGVWSEILSTEANIGKNGIGKTKEGDGKTPRGEYRFTFGFGIKADPGTSLSYMQVDDTYYWVDDSDSQYYNQFVSTKDVSKDWNSAEHILSAQESYHYVLATNYNEECTPGAGSAIFMHCKPTGGAGCIAVSEESMIQIMKIVQPDCVLIIDDITNIYNY